MTVEYQKNKHEKDRIISDTDPKMKRRLRKQQLLKLAEEKRKNKNLLEKNVKPLIEEPAQVPSTSIESLSENRNAYEIMIDTDKFFADEEERVRMKLEMEGQAQTKARTETPVHKKYKKESENKPRTQSFVSNEEIRAHDKK
ncbi:MAG: hypothetical protein IJ192_04600 [Clostridia bacterium]|nr:hypothetical protein [Clostridia bacterium]